MNLTAPASSKPLAVPVPVTARPTAHLCGERFNTLSHLMALLLALAFGGGLVLRTIAGGEPMKMLGAAVFTAATAMLYAASVLYHGSAGLRKQFWQRVDHAAIFLLIAGTSTPFALVDAAQPWQRAALIAIWLLAGLGVMRELGTRASGVPSLALYLLMGWLSVFAAMPVAAGHSNATLAWLIAGGICYSAGTVYYRNPRGRAHAHGIWHLFVLAGSASHFLAIAHLLA